MTSIKHGALRWSILVGKQKHNGHKTLRVRDKGHCYFEDRSRILFISVHTQRLPEIKLALNG